MSDGFNSQLNAFLAAAVAQQQQNQQQSHSQSSNSNNQMPLFGMSQAQMLSELQKQQLSQNLNQFNLQQPHGSQMGMLGGLNEQSLQSLLLSQSLQKLNSQGNQMNSGNLQQQRNQNNLLPNQQTFGQMPLIPNDQLENQFRNNDNSILHGNGNFNNNNQRQQYQHRQQQQQQYQEPPTRVLEPYFSDDSPFNSLDHQIGISGSSSSQGQFDMFNEFKKISLNESMNRANNSNNCNSNNSRNETPNPNNHNNSHHNTSSNFDNSMFSLNDSDIYNADQNYMPGTASLIEDVDKQIMVVLRDGRTLIGYLRSIDQYANLLLSSTFERIHVGNKYGDVPKGIYIIRGENVVLIGEVDFKLPVKVDMVKVDIKEILELQKEEQKAQENERNQKKALLERCQIPNTDAVLDEYY